MTSPASSPRWRSSRSSSSSPCRWSSSAGSWTRPAGTVRELTTHTLPAIDEAAQTIREANGQLVKVDTITTSAARVTEDVSALTTLVSATVGGPLIKLSAFSYAVRSVLGGRKAR